MKKINEEFLHFLWKNQHLTGVTFYTDRDVQLRVMDPGVHNHSSGPDFFNAKIELDGTLWAGNIELHINASDWIKHRHSGDKSYDSIILHVVYFNDCQITRLNGELIPTAILRFPSLLWDTYLDLQKNKNWIPCQNHLFKTEAIHFAQWTSTLMVSKLEEKSRMLKKSMEDLNGHWDAILCASLFRSFGIPINSTPFEMLSLLVPYTLLLRNKNDLFVLESILFGQAGMLQSDIPRDKYSEAMKNEFLRHSGKLEGFAVPNHIWKYMRMRPSSFPSLRIAQLASFIKHLFPFHAKLEKRPGLKELQDLMRVKAGDYWNTHYRLGKESPSRIKYLGEDFIHLLLINSIVPYLFFYGKTTKKPEYSEYAVRLLEELPAENNVILKKWGKFGIHCTSAFESQALLFLYKNYCKQKRCLDCQFGNNMIINGGKK